MTATATPPAFAPTTDPAAGSIDSSSPSAPAPSRRAGRPAATSERPPRVTERSVGRAEWIKFTSVRSYVITLASAGLALVAFGAIFSALAGSGRALPPNAVGVTDSLTLSLSGMNLSQLILGVLGALFVAGEYSSGMIRTMFTAVADRLPVLRAKALVLGGTTWATMTVASFAAFFAGRAVYAGDGATLGLGDPGVLRAVLGAGVFGAGVVLLGLALGFLLRSTAAAIGTLVGLLMIAPTLISLLPPAVSDLARYLPSNAGQAMFNAGTSSTLLSPGAGAAMFAAWVIGLLGLAALVLRRRDA